MRRIFNYIASDIGFFRLWMTLSLIGSIITWKDRVLAEINLTQFLIATGVVAIINKLDKKEDNEDKAGDEKSNP